MNHIQQDQNGLAKFITDPPQRVLLISAVCHICGHGTDRRENAFTETSSRRARRTFMKAMCIQRKYNLNFEINGDEQ